MTPKQLERLKERRDEIITVAMGRCWHKWIVNPPLWDVKHNTVTPHYHCILCNNDSINTNNPDYSTPEGWFELYNWLTKENPEWWIKFTERYYAYNTTLLNNWGDDVGIFINNFPDLFVQWLAETETGWYNEGELTPLGKLMKEVLDEEIQSKEK